MRIKKRKIRSNRMAERTEIKDYHTHKGVSQIRTSVLGCRVKPGRIRARPMILPPFDYKTPKVPEGYEVTGEHRSPLSYEIKYQGESGEWLSYTQSWAEGSGLAINTEWDEGEEIRVGQYEGLVFRSVGEDNVLWADDRYYYMISGTCSRDELLEITADMERSIRWKSC